MKFRFYREIFDKFKWYFKGVYSTVKEKQKKRRCRVWQRKSPDKKTEVERWRI